MRLTKKAITVGAATVVLLGGLAIVDYNSYRKSDLEYVQGIQTSTIETIETLQQLDKVEQSGGFMSTMAMAYEGGMESQLTEYLPDLKKVKVVRDTLAGTYKVYKLKHISIELTETLQKKDEFTSTEYHTKLNNLKEQAINVEEER